MLNFQTCVGLRKLFCCAFFAPFDVCSFSYFLIFFPFSRLFSLSSGLPTPKSDCFPPNFVLLCFFSGEVEEEGREEGKTRVKAANTNISQIIDDLLSQRGTGFRCYPLTP